MFHFISVHEREIEVDLHSEREHDQRQRLSRDKDRHTGRPASRDMGKKPSRPLKETQPNLNSTREKTAEGMERRPDQLSRKKSSSQLSEKPPQSDQVPFNSTEDTTRKLGHILRDIQSSRRTKQTRHSKREKSSLFQDNENQPNEALKKTSSQLTHQPLHSREEETKDSETRPDQLLRIKCTQSLETLPHTSAVEAKTLQDMKRQPDQPFVQKSKLSTKKKPHTCAVELRTQRVTEKVENQPSQKKPSLPVKTPSHKCTVDMRTVEATKEKLGQHVKKSPQATESFPRAHAMEEEQRSTSHNSKNSGSMASMEASNEDWNRSAIRYIGVFVLTAFLSNVDMLFTMSVATLPYVIPGSNRRVDLGHLNS